MAATFDFFTQAFEGCTFLYNLAVFAWISLLFVFKYPKANHKLALRLVIQKSLFLSTDTMMMIQDKNEFHNKEF